MAKLQKWKFLIPPFGFILFIFIVFLLCGCQKKESQNPFDHFQTHYLGQSLTAVQAHHPDVFFQYIQGSGYIGRQPGLGLDLRLSCDSLCTFIDEVSVYSDKPCFGALCVGSSINNILLLFPDCVLTLKMPEQKEMFIIPHPQETFVAHLFVRSSIGQQLGRYQLLNDGSTSSDFDKNGRITSITIKKTK